METKQLSENQHNVPMEVLPDTPSTSYWDFIVSTAFERRQTISERDRLFRTTIQHTVLPSWLEPAYVMGPYERKILSSIIGTPHNLVLFRSGTGSGKSSILNYLAFYCGNRSVRRHYYNKVHFPIRNVFSVLDFDGIEKKFSEELDSEDDKHLQEQRIAEIYDKTSEFLRTAIFSTFRSTSIDSHTFLGSLFRKALQRKGPFITGVYNFIQSINIRLGTDWEARDDAELFTSILNIIDDEPDPEFRLSIWLSIWCELAYIAKKRTPEIPIMISFDNVDQLAGYLQHRLSILLQQFFTDQYCRNSGLKIIYMMRLSSARDYLAALPEPFMMKAHEAPSPIDLITIRLTTFLLSPDSFKSYSLLDTREQREMYARFYSFYIHLIDVSGDMRKLLQGLSGTNLRIGFAQSRKWITSPQNSKHPNLTLNSIETIQNRIFRNIVPNAILKITHAIGRGIESIPESRIKSHKSPKNIFPEIYIDELAFQISSVLKHSRLLSMKESRVRGPRCDVGQSIGSAAVRFLADGSHRKQLPKRSKLVLYLACSFYKENIFQNPNSAAICSATVAHAERVLDTLVEEILAKSDREITPIVKYFVGLVCDGMRAVIQPGFNVVDRRPFSVRPDRVGAIEYDMGLAHITRSRFEAASMMLEGAEIIENVDWRPLNLFRSSEPYNSVLPLYILYRISEDKAEYRYQNAASLSRLRRDILDFNFDDGDLTGCITEMIRRDRRIIFSGVHDDARGVAAWLDEPGRIIRLTWSGKRYLEEVACSPPYIQWAFSQNAEFLARYAGDAMEDMSIVERVEFALKCFEEILREEKERFRNQLSKLKEQEEHDDIARRILNLQGFVCKGPVADLFLGSFPSFIESLINAIKGVSGSPFTSKETMVFVVNLLDLTENWTVAARGCIDDYRAIFGSVPEEWENVYSFCADDLEKFTKDNRRFLERCEKGA